MRVATIFLTIFGVILFLIALAFILTGWFLPEPQYQINSFPGVIFFEILKSTINLLLDMIILLLPIFLISIFVKPWNSISNKERFYSVVAIAFFISIVVVGFSIIKSILLWQPLESSTRFAQERIFDRGRGGAFGAQKIYRVEFTTSSNNLSFIPNKIIPLLKSYGCSVNQFSVFIGKKEYISFEPILANSIQVQSINEIPFNNPLANLDFSSINFQCKKVRGGLHLLTGNYRSNGIITGSLSYIE